MCWRKEVVEWNDDELVRGFHLRSLRELRLNEWEVEVGGRRSIVGGRGERGGKGDAGRMLRT